MKSAPDRAVLDVAVLNPVPVPSKTIRAVVTMTALVRDPVGHEWAIDMRTVAENGRISYLGIVLVTLPRIMMDFTIGIRLTDGKVMTMHFRELLLQYSDR